MVMCNCRPQRAWLGMFHGCKAIYEPPDADLGEENQKFTALIFLDMTPRTCSSVLS